MARPLAWTGAHLKEMTDAELDRLIYYLQVAYAAQLDAGGKGYVYVGGTGGTVIGSASDTSSTYQENTTAAPADNIIQSYPVAPGIGSETDTTYTYRQDQSVPTFPSAATQDADGYTYYTGTNIRVTNTEAHLYDEILAQAITEIRSGNEVGGYRVASAEPTAGGAGTWSDKGTFFLDSRYAGTGDTTYKLWLKTALTTVPGTNVYPVGVVTTGAHLRQRPITNTDPLIQNILLPALTYQLGDGVTSKLKYSVSTTAGGTDKGIFTDTKYDQSTDGTYATGTGASEVYHSSSTPNTAGTTTTVSTYYFRLDA